MVNGDIGIFCVDGGTVCKQYYRDSTTVNPCDSKVFSWWRLLDSNQRPPACEDLMDVGKRCDTALSGTFAVFRLNAESVVSVGYCLFLSAFGSRFGSKPPSRGPKMNAQ